MIKKILFDPFTSLDGVFLLLLFAIYYGQNHEKVRQQGIIFDSTKGIYAEFEALGRAVIACSVFVIFWYYIYEFVPFIDLVTFQESIYLLGNGLICLVLGIGIVVQFHNNDDYTN